MSIKTSTGIDAGRKFVDEWFDVKRSLTDQEAEELKNLVKSLYGFCEVENRDSLTQ